VNFIRFENSTGEGLIGFEEARTSGPEVSADSNRWYAGLTVGGNRIFQYGSPCGTCGIIFEKVASPEERLSDAAAVRLLGQLDHLPSESVLRQLARVLAQGPYYVAVIETSVRLVSPGESDDYFASEVARLFGLEPPDYERPSNPGTAYYRIGSDQELDVPYSGGEVRVGSDVLFSYPGGTTKTLLTQILMPFQNPLTLDRRRVAYWKSRVLSGFALTAFAVSVLDNQAPATEKGDKDYPYNGQMLLTHCLIDGHHRVQAASETKSRIRILTFLAPLASNVDKNFDYALVLEKIAAQVPVTH
jgi:hypothetical protein